jgi:hypothetical protein
MQVKKKRNSILSLLFVFIFIFRNQKNTLKQESTNKQTKIGGKVKPRENMLCACDSEEDLKIWLQTLVSAYKRAQFFRHLSAIVPYDSI